jgi:hypothetical protein
MKPRHFRPGCVGIVVNSLAIDFSPACGVRTGWQAGAAAAAPASGNAARIPGYALLPDEKIHRFHLGRHGFGLI